MTDFRRQESTEACPELLDHLYNGLEGALSRVSGDGPAACPSIRPHQGRIIGKTVSRKTSTTIMPTTAAAVEVAVETTEEFWTSDGNDTFHALAGSRQD